MEGNEEDAAAPAESDGKRARLFLSAKKMFNGGKTLAGQCCSATRSGRGGKGDTVLPESSQQMGRWVDAEVAGRRDGGTHENACRNLLTIGLAHASAKVKGSGPRDFCFRRTPHTCSGPSAPPFSQWFRRGTIRFFYECFFGVKCHRG